MNNSFFFRNLIPCLMLISISKAAFAQANPTGYLADESQLAVPVGTTIITDPTADKGYAIFKGINSADATIWYGPYVNLQGGNYLLHVRLKVSSNVSTNPLFTFDAVSNLGSTVHASLPISANMFRNSNEWQLFTIPIQLPANVTTLELRGIGFQAGITDLSLDYIHVIPGDFRGNYSAEFTVTGKGDVGIGTNSPSEKLAVNGKIRAKEIKVETNNWPDYVFKADHKLPPLAEIETFIKTNNHLPEIPSAAEAEKEGVS